MTFLGEEICSRVDLGPFWLVVPFERLGSVRISGPDRLVHLVEDCDCGLGRQLYFFAHRLSLLEACGNFAAELDGQLGFMQRTSGLQKVFLEVFRA